MYTDELKNDRVQARVLSTVEYYLQLMLAVILVELIWYSIPTEKRLLYYEKLVSIINLIKARNIFSWVALRSELPSKNSIYSALKKIAFTANV